MRRSEFKDIELANILMQQYANLRQEIFQFMGYYKSYVRYFLTAVTLLVALVTVILKSDTISFFGDGRTFLIPLIYIMTTVVGFISFDILESQFSIIVLGSNLKILEHQINNLVGKKIITWESEYAPNIKRAVKPFPGALNPNIFVIAYGTIIISGGAFVIPLYWILSFWSSASVVQQGWVVGGVIYSVSTVILLVITAKGTLIDIDEHTRTVSGHIPAIKPVRKLNRT